MTKSQLEKEVKALREKLNQPDSNLINYFGDKEPEDPKSIWLVLRAIYTNQLIILKSLNLKPWHEESATAEEEVQEEPKESQDTESLEVESDYKK